MSSEEKPTNPKDLIGTNKVPLDLVPASALAVQALAHLEGHLKYGLVNWREKGVKSSIYTAAMMRHLVKYLNGEWADPITKVPHLGSICACANIIIDAKVCGKLTDDRPKQAPIAEFIDSLSETVEHLRELFKDKNPHHYIYEENRDETKPDAIDYDAIDRYHRYRTGTDLPDATCPCPFCQGTNRSTASNPYSSGK